MIEKCNGVHAYLEQHAAFLKRELTDKEVIALKKEYRREYLKAYKKRYRAKHKAVSVSLTPKEYQRFLERVEKSGQKARVYIKEALLSTSRNESKTKLYESILRIIDLIDEGLFESNLKRIKEALVYLNNLKNKLS